MARRIWRTPTSNVAKSSAATLGSSKRGWPAATTALVVSPSTGMAGKTVAEVAALAALVSFGPQKNLDPQSALTWPAVRAAQVAVITLFVRLAMDLRAGATDVTHA